MPVEPHEALKSLVRRRDERRQAAEHRAIRLRAAVPAAIALLRTRYGVGRAWLFGSLAWGSARPDSDVDIAVEGLPSEHYFAALADVAALLRAPVDLVRLEEAGTTLRDRILSDGVPA